MAPTKINYKIYQGSTFNEVLRLESSTKVYKPITSVFQTAPLVVTAVAHDIPVGWRAIMSNVGGMTELNTLGYLVASATTTDTVTFNSVNAVGFRPYTTGGILEYNQPTSLAGTTGKMQIRAKVNDPIVLLELSSANGGIIIDDVLKTITILIQASVTELFLFKTAVYSLELTTGSVVTPFIYGNMTLDTEITR